LNNTRLDAALFRAAAAAAVVDLFALKLVPPATERNAKRKQHGCERYGHTPKERCGF